MKTSLQITASFDKPELIEYIAESLASHHIDYGYAKVEVPKGWKAIETSSVENYVSGTMDIMIDEHTKISVPFKTCFLFSCTKEGNEHFKMDWGTSFS